MVFIKKAAVLFCLVLGVNVQIVQARPDPSPLADNCISEVQRIAEQSYDRIYDVKTAAVDDITDLLLAGQTRKANVTAFQAITRIRIIQRLSVITIMNNGRWCVRFLDRMGWPDLADQVMLACEMAIEQIRFDANSAVQEIQDALSGQTGGEEGGEEDYE
jgi:hypothetical protein